MIKNHPKVMDGFMDEMSKLGAGWGGIGMAAKGVTNVGGKALKFMTHSNGKFSIGRSLTSAFIGSEALRAGAAGVKGVRQAATAPSAGTMQQFKNPYYLY